MFEFDTFQNEIEELLSLYIMLCGRVPAANVPGCTANPGLNRSYLHREVSPPQLLVVIGRTTWARNGNFDRKLRLPRMHFQVLLHAANMRHGTNGFTSLPKKGVLRIISPWKIRRLLPSLNPRTWVPKASTLPLDRRSRSLLCIRDMLAHLSSCNADFSDIIKKRYSLQSVT